jgi:dethiobiotin synthetase
MSARFAITGTDTGIGKTVFAAALTGAIGASYWKPVQAGLDEESDSELVARLSGQPVLSEAYRLMTPCSPHLAAQIDGVKIDPERFALPHSPERLVVEGAGGALVPLVDELLYADIFARWNLPVIIVARTALGTINHSLMTVEALRSRNVPICGLAFVGDANDDSEQTIVRLSGVRRLGRLGFVEPLDKAGLAKAFAEGFNLSDFQ